MFPTVSGQSKGTGNGRAALTKLDHDIADYAFKDLQMPTMSIDALATQGRLQEQTQQLTDEAARVRYYRPPSKGLDYEPKVPFVLREYQKEGIEFLKAKKRCFLADQPRLGKTVQAAAAAEVPCLILAPTYLTQHWYDFLLTCGIPPNRISLARGNHAKKQAALDAPADWHIGNIEMLRIPRAGTRAHEDRFRFQVPTTLIIDEAHHLRGRNSQQSRGALELAQKTGVERVYLISGTPVLNKPDDLFSTLRILDPKTFTSYYEFIRKFCKVVDYGWGPKVVAARDPRVYRPLRELFRNYSITRTAKEVGLQLSALTSQIIRVQPDDDFMRDYKALKYTYTNYDGEQMDNLMETMVALRRMTVLPKLTPLLSLLTDTHALEGTVIFTWFKDSARLIGQALKCPVITGDEPPHVRLEIAKSDKCIVANIAAMSEGVDLSHLHTSIFFELDYVPGRTYQALSRNALCPEPRHAYYILAKDTIDETIYKANQDRTMTIREIVKDALN